MISFSMPLWDEKQIQCLVHEIVINVVVIKFEQNYLESET